MLVWGGHPAITPMIWVVAESMGVDYGKWVKLYQSRYFKDDFPEDNERFQNVRFTDAVKDDRDNSLRLMRERMFMEQNFEAAVFIGGMEGIVEEFDLFTKFQPDAQILPIASTGGAAIELAHRLKSLSKDLQDDLDYVSLFHRRLRIAPRELRYDRAGAGTDAPDRTRHGRARTLSTRARQQIWRPRPALSAGGDLRARGC